jgi:hypothetical protein
MRQAAEAGIGGTGREPAWSESVGIGDEAFLADLKMRLGPKGIRMSPGVLVQAKDLSEKLANNWYGIRD